MWLLGIGFALVPLGYGMHCLTSGHARFFGEHGSYLELDGSAAVALAIAYIAIWRFHPTLIGFGGCIRGLSH